MMLFCDENYTAIEFDNYQEKVDALIVGDTLFQDGYTYEVVDKSLDDVRIQCKQSNKTTSFWMKLVASDGLLFSVVSVEGCADCQATFDRIRALHSERPECLRKFRVKLTGTAQVVGYADVKAASAKEAEDLAVCPDVLRDVTWKYDGIQHVSGAIAVSR